MGAWVSKPNDRQPVELLKNALLAFALSTVYQSKGLVEESSKMNYCGYDGTKLPRMNGCDLSNACFSFIESPQQAAKGPWGSQRMVDRANAIQKFISVNLSTEKQVIEFFDAFLNHLAECAQEQQNADGAPPLDPVVLPTGEGGVTDSYAAHTAATEIHPDI